MSNLLANVTVDWAYDRVLWLKSLSSNHLQLPWPNGDEFPHDHFVSVYTHAQEKSKRRNKISINFKFKNLNFVCLKNA